MRFVLLGAAIVLVASCLRQVNYSCAEDSFCVANGQQGTCESSGYCSFADATCPNGRRYSDVGPYANQCTGTDVPVDGRDLDGAARDGTIQGITWEGTATTAVPASGMTTAVLALPTGVVAGDILLAMLAFGHTGQTALPVFTAPTGWTLVRRVDQTTASSLAVYWRAATSAEPSSYTWQFDEPEEGVVWISAYAGVSTDNPIDVEMGLVRATAGTSYATPSLTTTGNNEMLLAAYVSHAANVTTWTAPATTTVRASLGDGTTRSGLGTELLVANAGATGTFTATSSIQQDYAIVDALALRAAQ